MKVGISRFIIVAAIVALVLVGSVAPVLAQSPSFSDFSSIPNPNLILNGRAAKFSTNVLRLTPASTGLPGSAWFRIPQPVSGGFTTTFTFQISSTTAPPADGLAFVIQNDTSETAGTAALDIGGGGSIGYGSNPDVSLGTPISNSLAVEFDTFQNSGDPDSNHVAVQSCGTGPNSSDETATYDDGTPCNLGTNSSLPITLADGNPHTVEIDYEPAPPLCEFCSGTLHVILLDDPAHPVDLFSDGISVDLSSRLSLGSGGTALVGFTAATGDFVENNDILSWTFTPHTSTTIEEIIPPGELGIFTFGSFNYKVQNSNNTALDLIVTANPLPPNTTLPSPGGQCIVYAGTGGNCWGFDVHCPTTGCTASTANLALATSYDSDQPAAFFTSPGFLKIEPNCAAIGTTGATATDQITEFVFLRQDPTTKGTSGGGLSCWVATINTPTPYAAFIQQPINADGLSVFTAKRGVVPVKFTLTDNGSATCILPPAIIAVTRTTGGTEQPVLESTYMMAADSGSNFRVSGCQYVYNLAASAMGPGTYRVDISIAGQIVGSATFTLK